MPDAAARDKAEVAACLLAGGADPGLVDDRGRSALDAANTPPETLHAIRQHYHRRRAPTGAPTVSDQARQWAEELDEKGIVKVSGLVGPELLARLRREFADFIAHLEASRARGEGAYVHYDEEEHFWDKDNAFVCNNAFKYSNALVEFSCNPLLIDAAEIYLGRTPHIQRGGAMRYLPSPPRSNDMFGWHHDMEDKRFKVQVLLTGVDGGGAGQNMSYVMGSHKLFHPYRMFIRNECRPEYFHEHVRDCEIFDAIGEAGDVFIFDSNGVHRGNRRETAAERDVFMVEYTADASFIWGGDVDPSLVRAMPTPNPFERLVRAEKVWDQPTTRKLPMWLENLPHVERWL